MPDNLQFREEVLKKLEAKDFDFRILEELANLSPEDRSRLAELLMERKAVRAKQDGG